MRRRSEFRRSRYRPDVDQLTLGQVGLTQTAVLFIGIISLLPFVGLLIGGYYSNQTHHETRSFGRALFAFAIVLHFIYGCLICPALLYISLSQIF